MSADLARELVNAVLAAVEHADDGNAPNSVAEAAIAAAEERGRLVGDAEWLAAIRKRDANCNGPSWLTTSKREHGCNGCAPLRALLDRALAPRDSGKEG